MEVLAMVVGVVLTSGGGEGGGAGGWVEVEV